MTPPRLEFPALYNSADEGAATAQSTFLWTIRWEYFLLFCVSLSSATRNLSGMSPVVITLLLVVLAGLFVFKVYRKLDQDWYRCRALAESIKTTTWRFSMRAHPFEDSASIEVPKAKFRNLLREILSANRNLAENLQSTQSEQVTAEMLEIRKMPLNDRILYYVSNRIDDQRSWYARKSADNKRTLRYWVAITIFVYLAAAISINADVLGFGWVTYGFDPLIVVVTSIIGWIQIKRHSELTASYNLTAHEIGIIRGNSDNIRTESEFSDFVNESELAFSREHTQWVARRDVN